MTNNVHPLALDHDLEKVFRNLLPPQGRHWGSKRSRRYSPVEIGEAKAIRLVCKQWRYVGTRVFRKHRKPLVFTGATAEEDLTRFLDVMRDSNLIPGNAYELGPTLFSSKGGDIGRNHLFFQFLEVCWLSLVKLEVTLAEDFTLDFSSFPRMDFPSLKSLSLTLALPNERVRSPKLGDHEELLVTLLKTAVHLREFHLDFSCFSTGHQDDFFLCSSLLRAAFSALPTSTSGLCLENVMLNSNSADLATLTGRNIKLEEFSLHCRGPVGTQCVLEFLKSQAPTLKRLHLDSRSRPRLGYTPCEDMVFSIPPLPVLEELTLYDVGARGPPIAEGFGCLRKLNMKEWLRQDVYGECLQLLVGGMVKDKHPLSDLRLPVFAEVGMVKAVGVRLANIRQLEYVPAHREFSEFVEIARTIFQHYLNLEVLHMAYFPPEEEFQGYNLDNMDFLLSGMTEDDCALLRMEKMSLGGLCDITRLSKFPSITNLKKLRMLHLVKLGDTPFHVMTNLSAQLFLQMKSLRELRIASDTFHPDLNAEVRGLLESKLKTSGGDDPYDFAFY